MEEGRIELGGTDASTQPFGGKIRNTGCASHAAMCRSDAHITLAARVSTEGRWGVPPRCLRRRRSQRPGLRVRSPRG
eukprot:2223975-Alexandrium_andersonii.AAC.1